MVKKPRRISAADPQHAAIVAGFRREPCPPGANQFTHLSAEFASSRTGSWPRFRGVFMSLPRDERRAIIRLRRMSRLAGEGCRRLRESDGGERLVWIAAHRVLYGEPLPDHEPHLPNDPNDPRRVLRG